MSFFQRIFSPRPAAAAGRALYIGAVNQARRPDFYSRLGVADTLEGRFELYTLHVGLLIERLAADATAKDVSQALFDAYLHGLDDALRDEGVGDLSVGKKMRKLGQAAYGRLKSLRTALQDPDPAAVLAPFLKRTVYQEGEGDAAALTAYVLAAQDTLAARAPDQLADPDAWPVIP